MLFAWDSNLKLLVIFKNCINFLLINLSRLYVIKKVCLVVNTNYYESKSYFTQKLHEAFLRAGIESRIVKYGTFYTPEEMERLRQEKPDLTISFNTILPMSGGEYISDFLHIPHLSIHVDPALYVLPLIKSPYAIISCVDKFDCETLKKSGFNNYFFLPHAVEKEMKHNPASNRPLDVVFFGTCYDYEALRENWEKKYPRAVCRVIEDAIELNQKNLSLPFFEVFEEVWKLSKLDPTGIDLAELAFYVDFYVRGLDRVELLRAINDVEVHVYGSVGEGFYGSMVKGWEYYLAGKSNVIIHPSVLLDKTFEILKQAKVSLNSMPFFKNGSHDRIFSGLACGSLVLSTENIYIRENFLENEGVEFYRPKEWHKVNEVLSPYLKDENKRVEAVSKGQQKVLQNHTWDNRVQTILKEVPPILERIYEDNIDIHI